MEVKEPSELVRALLERRGITSGNDVAAFLNPDYDLHTHAATLLADIDIAVSRLLTALETKERIAIYADFDCDGIPGAALLSDFFKKVGHDNFEAYIPHRDREGYGFHIDAIRELAERGVSLIITVDVGTTAVDAVAFARERGVDVIVTDHHEIHGELPAAVAVVNPRRAPYPFAGLCGTATAFKLVQATLVKGHERDFPAFASIPAGWEKWLLDLVAIATVADMMELRGENRVLVKWGLEVLHRTPRKGIRALCAKLRLRQGDITEDDIGFSIAPRVNAASRMGEPSLAFRLLTTTDEREADDLADALEKLNASRKGVVSALVRQAKAHVKQRFNEKDRVVVLGDPEWKPALLGLAANSIMQERGGVVCLWGRDAQGRIKGSCRSDGSLSIVELFSSARDSLEEFGGHEKSGGFSVSHERVHTLHEVLRDAASSLVSDAGAGEAATHDARISLPELSRSLFADVSRLAPFGIGNPKPLFLIGNCIVMEMRRFGKESAHLELSLEDRRSGTRARAFDFFRSPESFTMPPVQGIEANVVASIERDTYRGGLCLRLVDIVAAN